MPSARVTFAPSWFRGDRQGHASPGDHREKDPLGRIGEVQDLLGLAVYPACDESSFMTGSVIHIDGGWEGYGYL